MEIRKKTTGWGRYPVVESSTRVARSVGDLTRFATEPKSTLAQGSRRSYGDACLFERVVSALPLNRFLSFDDTSGVLRAEAGVTIEETIRFFLPRGWFPAVTPGTKHPTLGGCIAADVHGKNHHGEGSIANYVDELEMVLANGDRVTCSRQQLPELFWATVGGMGLTGFIYAASMRLKRVESSFIQLRTERTGSLEETCQLLVETQDESEYSVAWIDTVARGRSCGRGLCLLGTHAAADDRRKPFPLHRNGAVGIPGAMPSVAFSRTGVQLFNSLYYRHQLPLRTTRLIHYDPFFYPLDRLANWNRLYGRRGFLQYQLVVPFADGFDALTDILALLHARKVASTLAVLKTFGEAESGPLSFPAAGLTLALDFPCRPAVFAALKGVTDVVAAAGGRLYLAKDAILEREQFAGMYPRLSEFLATKKKYDPCCRFRSHLSDRLGLT